MKFKYVILLEILRIMVSVSQIIDAKNTYKSVQECQEFRKSTNEKQRWIVNIFIWSESSRLGESKTGLRSQNGQENKGVLFDWTRRCSEILNGSGKWFACGYICVCIWLKMKKKSAKCGTYTSTDVRRNLVNDQVAPHSIYREDSRRNQRKVQNALYTHPCV